MKGAYSSRLTAYPAKSDVDEAYFKLASRLLQDGASSQARCILRHDLNLQARSGG